MVSDLIRLTAREIRLMLKNGSISPLELLECLAERISAIDPTVNALPTLCFDRAFETVKKQDMSTTALGGIPIAIKDLMEVSGVRTTWGSKIYENNISLKSDLLVERLEQQGAIIYAKSNTPEFGAGANTFNEVFGITRNPWNTNRSAAGSSGGSAVALATGMAWLATGSDLGGSLRSPASFCGIVGLRPSVGRVPANPGDLAFDRLSVEGPMARNIGDLAMLFDAMVGHDVRDPISLPTPLESFETAADARQTPRRIAFSKNLGVSPVDPEIALRCERAAQLFTDMDVVVEEAHPDFSGLQDVFQTLRALNFAASLGPLLESHRDFLKPEVIWNIEKGLKLNGDQIIQAMKERSKIYARTTRFFEKYDLLLSPTTIVPPFPAEKRFVDRIGDYTFANYIEWCSIAYAFTVVGSPALSMPCDVTDEGLPIGLQIASNPRNEAALLGAAMMLEDAVSLQKHPPIDPN